MAAWLAGCAVKEESDGVSDARIDSLFKHSLHEATYDKVGEWPWSTGPVKRYSVPTEADSLPDAKRVKAESSDKGEKVDRVESVDKGDEAFQLLLLSYPE